MGKLLHDGGERSIDSCALNASFWEVGASNLA
jgi:hypothetical protein